MGWPIDEDRHRVVAEALAGPIETRLGEHDRPRPAVGLVCA